MLSIDRVILDPASPAAGRMREYSSLVEKLDILVLTKSNYLKSFFYKPAHKIDLITCQDPFETGFLGWILARRLRVKLQLQAHTDFLSPYFSAESFKNKIRVRLAKFLLSRADCIRVVSKRIADSLRTMNYKLRTSPVALPIFVDVEKIRNAPVTTDLHKKYPQFDFIILMASRLTREKNIGLAIEALREVIKSHPKTGLVIVGSGPEERKLKLMTNDYGLMTNVVFEQWTDNLSSYYKTADLFLLTSFYEGYGLTLVEALSAGAPVISTDVGEAVQLGVILTKRDPADLADKIRRLIEGKIKYSGRLPELPTKEEYLRRLKESWFSCGNV